MPARFTRLRLVGFKSFAEPALIEILPGLTGIVGPNGCGKSNVVEALRFVMGEANARSIRGSEIEDVIFAGTAGRPARNLAEVTLTLEAADQPLPVPFHEVPELAISRSVERGRGSISRANGREVRGRDVQTLFADLGSGPRSSALTGQGRITALITARPEERRAVLEEAAGITGLHARRHEAELKLAAAEANVVRAQELKAELELQLAGLKRQARQARRYQNIGGAIREAEAELLAIEKARAEGARAAAAETLLAARLAVGRAAEESTRAAAIAAETAAGLPARREAEAAARTGLERARLAREQIDAEVRRTEAALAEASARLTEIDRDLAHSAALASDAEAAEARLAAENAALAASLAELPGLAEQAAEMLAGAAGDVERAQADADRAAGEAAATAAGAAALAQELGRVRQRQARLDEEHERLEAERLRIAAQRPPPERLAEAEAAERAAEASLASARSEREKRENERATAIAAHEQAREQAAVAEAERLRLAAEAAAITALLSNNGAADDGDHPLADRLAVPSGLEAALAAAFGDALIAGESHWKEFGVLVDPPPLPAPAEPLARLLPAPPQLARALPLIGLIGEPAEAAQMQERLAPGQALVSRDGGLWRWDGYTVPPGTQSAAAMRLAERNRLAGLTEHLTIAEAAAGAATLVRDEVAAAERAAVAAATAAEAAYRGAEQGWEELRRAGDALRREAGAAGARLDSLDERATRLVVERTELGENLARLEAERAGLANPEAARASLASMRAALAEARSRQAVAIGEQRTIEEKASGLAARREAIATERQGWAERAADAARRAGELAERRAQGVALCAELAARPAELAEARAAAIEALEAGEAAHGDAAAALAEGEAASAATERAARAAERSVAAAREDEVRAEGGTAQAEAAFLALAERIRERLGAGTVLPDPPAEPEAEAAARRRLERLLGERAAMGPVNLRAEIEAAEVEARVMAIVREGEELNAAIAKLRGSIGHLNREGRARLAAVFTEVDRHFQSLFARMFGGGRAHLALVGSDDALIAGLEIYAQPPGKKLAQLSLLSGGEQALVALSLVFAVFRCNPGPIAILDEVDAPLDDVNVERFCRLIEDVVRESGTRMLVVTHHPLTMARMDRLYGVTMQERGISRVLSVDLARAAELADPPLLAAE